MNHSFKHKQKPRTISAGFLILHYAVSKHGTPRITPQSAVFSLPNSAKLFLFPAVTWAW